MKKPPNNRTSRPNSRVQIGGPVISVVVCTYNRPAATLACLQSIRRSSVTDYEVIVVDQSEATGTQMGVEKLADARIRYYTDHHQGLSWARNLGSAQAQAPLLAFTDSDCLVDTHWLQMLIATYRQRPDIDGILGMTKPYQPEKHLGQVCPSIFLVKNGVDYSTLTLAGLMNLGSGNNMSFRRRVFAELGGFRTWLGTGSLGQAAEDSEFFFRLLLRHYSLRLQPDAVVYHNRWLTLDQESQLQSNYTCGWLVVFIYYLFSQYHRQSWQFLWAHLQSHTWPLIWHTGARLKQGTVDGLPLVREGVGWMKGLCLGLVIVMGYKLGWWRED